MPAQRYPGGTVLGSGSKKPMRKGIFFRQGTPCNFTFLHRPCRKGVLSGESSANAKLPHSRKGRGKRGPTILRIHCRKKMFSISIALNFPSGSDWDDLYRNPTILRCSKIGHRPKKDETPQPVRYPWQTMITITSEPRLWLRHRGRSRTCFFLPLGTTLPSRLQGSPSDFTGPFVH